ALIMTNALQIFEFILAFGAGTGLIFLLRWFWWRVNAWSEIAAMFSSGIISILFNFVYWPENIDPVYKFPLIVLITTIVWLTATFLTKPDDKETMCNFYKKIQPGGRGWKKVLEQARRENVSIVEDVKWTVPQGIVAMLYGSLFIYCLLFTTGNLIYNNIGMAMAFGIGTIGFGILLIRIWRKVRNSIL